MAERPSMEGAPKGALELEGRGEDRRRGAGPESNGPEPRGSELGDLESGGPGMRGTEPGRLATGRSETGGSDLGGLEAGESERGGLGGVSSGDGGAGRGGTSGVASGPGAPGSGVTGSGSAVPGSTILPWERTGSVAVADYRIFRVRRDEVVSPRTGRTFDRHILEFPDWVNVVPVTRDGLLILVEQYRHGTGEVTLEFPAGIVDPGEDPRAAGLRELEEETGYRAASCEVLGVVDANPAIQDNRVHVILATDCEPVGALRLDPGEDIGVRLATHEEVRRWVAEGRIRHAIAVLTWCLYALR